MPTFSLADALELNNGENAVVIIEGNEQNVHIVEAATTVGDLRAEFGSAAFCIDVEAPHIEKRHGKGALGAGKVYQLVVPPPFVSSGGAGTQASGTAGSRSSTKLFGRKKATPLRAEAMARSAEKAGDSPRKFDTASTFSGVSGLKNSSSDFSLSSRDKRRTVHLGQTFNLSDGGKKTKEEKEREKAEKKAEKEREKAIKEAEKERLKASKKESSKDQLKKARKASIDPFMPYGPKADVERIRSTQELVNQRGFSAPKSSQGAPTRSGRRHDRTVSLDLRATTGMIPRTAGAGARPTWDKTLKTSGGYGTAKAGTPVSAMARSASLEVDRKEEGTASSQASVGDNSDVEFNTVEEQTEEYSDRTVDSMEGSEVSKSLSSSTSTKKSKKEKKEEQKEKKAEKKEEKKEKKERKKEGKKEKKETGKDESETQGEGEAGPCSAPPDFCLATKEASRELRALEGEQLSSDLPKPFPNGECDDEKAESRLEEGDLPDSLRGLDHYSEIKHILKAFFSDFDGSYMELFQGMMLVATFHDEKADTTGLVLPPQHPIWQEGRYWMRFAAAAYGNMLASLKMKKKFRQMWLGISEDIAIVFQLSDFGKPSAGLRGVLPHGDKPVVFEHTGIAQEDFVTGWWGEGIARGGKEVLPGYYICLDHSSSNVILAIRGSSNLNDALTDMVGRYEAYEDGAVHAGMMHCTRLLLSKIKGVLFSTLEKYPSYGFRICGHSLGAGITSLMTLVFKKEFSHIREDVKGYAYACPCTMDSVLSEYCKDFLKTFVLGDDCVSRISYGSLDELKQTMKFFLANTGGLRHRLYQVAKYWTGMQTNGLAKLFLLSKENAKKAIAKYPIEMRREKLYPPGSCYHMSRTSGSGIGWSGVESNYEKFGTIIISGHMFIDHMPHTYEKALKDLADPLSRVTKRYKNHLAKKVKDKNSLADVSAVQNPLFGAKDDLALSATRKKNLAYPWEITMNRKKQEADIRQSVPAIPVEQKPMLEMKSASTSEVASLSPGEVQPKGSAEKLSRAERKARRRSSRELKRGKSEAPSKPSKLGIVSTKAKTVSRSISMEDAAAAAGDGAVKGKEKSSEKEKKTSKKEKKESERKDKERKKKKEKSSANLASLNGNASEGRKKGGRKSSLDDGTALRSSSAKRRRSRDRSKTTQDDSGNVLLEIERLMEEAEEGKKKKGKKSRSGTPSKRSASKADVKGTT